MTDKRRDDAITPGSPAANPGDEAPPGSAQTAENTCPKCHGTGSIQGQPCPDCGGTGRVNEIVGDA
jgi:DnaJ-class molecular chaperone